MKRNSFTLVTAFLLALCLTAPAIFAANPSAGSGQSKPNILVIWGDDIGQFNVSAYNMGIMGYRSAAGEGSCRCPFAEDAITIH
jgi:hypothetical protein